MQFPFILYSSHSLLMVNLDDDVGNTNKLGQWFFQTGEVLDARVECVKWFRDQKQFKPFIEFYDDLLTACPCSAIQASFDPRFSTLDADCVRSAWPVSFFVAGIDGLFRLRRKCCYRSSGRNVGALIKGKRGGHLELAYPRSYLTGNGEGRYEDVRARQLCCDESTECNLFYVRRPRDTCGRYLPPRRGESSVLSFRLISSTVVQRFWTRSVLLARPVKFDIVDHTELMVVDTFF